MVQWNQLKESFYNGCNFKEDYGDKSNIKNLRSIEYGILDPQYQPEQARFQSHATDDGQISHVSRSDIRYTCHRLDL